MTKTDDSTALLLRLARDLAQCVRFYSRLPLPRLPFEREAFSLPDFGRMPQVLPVAALIVAAPAAAVLAAGAALGLPGLGSATLCLAANALVTGAFHEDGLADVADGFGGGATRERKLEIMKDSRVGTFGASAVVFSFLSRAAALAGALDLYGAGGAVAAWLIAATLARLFGLAPLAALVPARLDGVAAAAQTPSPGALARGTLLGLALAAALCSAGGVSAAALTIGIGAAGAVTALLTRASARQIGGQTGDVAGGAEQLAEIAILTAFAASALQ
ncbi:MAG: adenosylcobinamide-GDP ribazoletransferase [Rhodoblastus sp.]|nr:MAG: adenosylcobinamide-GDP ribazoletransferase [Rhodoblastus sp.]